MGVASVSPFSSQQGWPYRFRVVSSKKSSTGLYQHHRDASPSMTCTACPPTRTFEMLVPFLLDLTKSWLGRLISTPCRISTVSSGWATPYLTIQADVQAAADPVAGSSIGGKMPLVRSPTFESPVSRLTK